MFDTIHFRLSSEDMESRVDFLREIPGSLTDVTTSERDNGEIWVKGALGNLSVIVNPYSVFVGYGSLCKWYLSDNFKVLDRADTERAIKALSDQLHLPMERARVTRVDIAAGFVMKYPAKVYFDHLGQMRATTRLQQPDGIYYTQTAKTLCFYDKVKEEKKKRSEIPELYDGKNVLRYEYRATSRLPQILKAPEVRAGLLYERGFYNYLLKLWRDSYRAIQKINETNVNFKMIATKKDLYRWGVLKAVESIGGQAEMLRQIDEARQRGELTTKQAYDLRAAVVQACKADGDMVVEADVIQELDKRVAEAYKMFT